MKITRILAVTAFTLTISSCNSQLKKQTSLNSAVDSLSYAIGLDVSKNVEKIEELNPDLFIQGFLEGKDSAATKLMEHKDTRAFLTTYFKKKQEREIEEKFGEYKKENEKFLAENKAKEGVITTESGLQYVVVKEGVGEVPTKDSKVKVHYHGTLTDGTVFDSSVDRGEPTEFGVSQVIKGWTEGLQLMKKGAKYKFFIPQELAYGAQQRGAKIKPFSALIFDVELLDINAPSLPAGHSAGDGHGH